jgi:hypothetical protein
MPSMTAAESAPTTHPTDTVLPGRVARALVTLGTVLVIIPVAVLPLLTPLFIHPALDVADAATLLGMETAQAHLMSDRSVEELVIGPGTFEFAGPNGASFYDIGERGHLRDARLLLWLFLITGAVSAGAIGVGLARAAPWARASLWRAVSLGGAASAVGVIVLGLISVVAFSTLFTLFHQIFFPAGNFTFDPATQRLVQLYPFRFWQIAAGGLGVGVAIVGSATWLIARRLARRIDGGRQP